MSEIEPDCILGSVNSNCAESECEPTECFRLCFQRRLNDYQSQHGSAAQGFGVVWEQTLEEVPVDEEAQGWLYRELILWARNTKLSTLPNQGGKTVRVADDDSGFAVPGDAVLEPQDYKEMWRRSIQEAQTEILHFHTLTRSRRVLSSHAHQLTNDLQNVYATTKTLRLNLS